MYNKISVLLWVLHILVTDKKNYKTLEQIIFQNMI